MDDSNGFLPGLAGTLSSKFRIFGSLLGGVENSRTRVDFKNFQLFKVKREKTFFSFRNVDPFCYLDVDILFGRRLEELDAQLVRQLLAPLGGDHPFVLHVALVADQDHLGIVARVRFDLRYPILHRIERLLVRDIVH